MESSVATHTAPQVFSSHSQLPQTRVDANMRRAVYPANSASNGSACLMSESNGRGRARRETGRAIERRMIGARRRIDGSDSWTTQASVSKAAEARPLLLMRMVY